MHQEDDLDDDPDSSHLIVSILRHVGPQLHLLRIDEFSSDILPAPKEIFTYCPNLVTLSVSGFDLKPLVDQGHPYLRNWLLGDPWNYHNEQAEVSVQIESCEEPGTSSFSSGWGGAAEVVKHRITEDDRDAALDVLSADKVRPSLRLSSRRRRRQDFELDEHANFITRLKRSDKLLIANLLPPFSSALFITPTS
ncbi:hypothetical protein BDY24DRAFT_227571 [Mrakia frigida]|uniref:uncharacterized protein n=1 Tax=Mrakia frigida TaxID=29902 RepID=UPI003FCBF71D